LDELALIEALGAAMLAAAEASDWDEVARLDDERHALLTSLDMQHFLEVGDEARRVLEQALEITQRLLKLSRDLRAEHITELTAVQRGQRGARAYLSSE
jgi:Flagellar protein FliT